ncbi:Vgb family protein [Albibacterium indicum]|uniref:Vgb family protein n=1 Tax=Albibacterium indicum TaxID=2292082 RepID=UPI0013009846|nr:hypothetical protein [Pedobacter indicus]
MNQFNAFFKGCIFCLMIIGCLPVFSQDLGGGFVDHGVASPISNHRGTVATVDGDGRNVVLVWLFDHRGGYALLMVDAETGESEEFTIPFPPNKDTPYSSILSKDNKLYTLFNGHFVEFDPEKRAFTFHQAVSRQMAMGMTEDDQGNIWAITYPSSGVVSFNPQTRELTDYGYVYKENWAQYQRYVASDDAGWIYFGLGNTASQIVAFDPSTAKAQAVLIPDERERGSAFVYRNENGKVYGQALRDDSLEWYELYRGQAKKIGTGHAMDAKSYITGSQTLFHRHFPDGKILKECNLTTRRLVVEDPKAKTKKELSFDYTSEGAWVMGIGVSPDNKISGGTSFPMRFFSYDPVQDRWENKAAPGQFNALTRQDDAFFFGVYPGGSLIEWRDGKPVHFIKTTPVIHRPHRLLAYPDGKTLILGGTPEYGYTGGGLLFWDREKETSVLLKDSSIVLDQSTMSLVALPKGKILGGTTTAPGTGGEKKAKVAELYIMDIENQEMKWNQVVLPGVQSYTDMCHAPNGLIYGLADRKIFFVFDPERKELVHQYDLTAEFGITAGEQSPRIFVHGEEGETYLLLRKGIAQINPQNYQINLLAESPIPIDAGGDYLTGRIYFVGGSHIYSYQLKPSK